MLIRVAVVVVFTALFVPVAALANDDAQPAPAPPAQPVDIDAAADAEAAHDLVGALVAAPAVRPPPPPEPMESLIGAPSAADMLMPFAKTMLMLGVVLALVWLTLHKGMGKLVEKAQAGKRVRVIERISLDARRTLFLVEVDGKQMILAGGDVVRVSDVDPVTTEKTERQGLFDKVLAVAGQRQATTTKTTTKTETEQAS